MWKRSTKSHQLRINGSKVGEVWPANRNGQRSDRIYVWCAWPPSPSPFRDGWSFTLSAAKKAIDKILKEE